MDRDTFFRLATLEICGDLNIETAMSRFVSVANEYVPVETMFLQVYESDLGAMRTIVTASKDSSAITDTLTMMPADIRALISENIDRYQEGIVAITSPESNPVAREMLAFHGISDVSILQILLASENRNLYGIILTAPGQDRYDDRHVDLMSMLVPPLRIALYNTLKHREVLELRDRLDDDNRFLQRELSRIAGDEIIGAEFGLRHVMDLVRQVSNVDSPVLLTGETGTGKDMIASAIHRTSDRRSGPFIAVNCGAIPEALVDSELFGHEKGAFTGALSARRGRFERADGGTILLDEIGEMPLSAQVRLLRVLQNHEIERVGGTDRLSIDTRVIAATNRNLPELIRAGEFREDLWFRLNVFPIEVPPLRDRTIDIPSLVQYFVKKKARELKMGTTPVLAPEAIEELLAYHWPGNVRELENVIERAMIVCSDGMLRFNLRPRPAAALPRSDDELPVQPLDQVIKEHIRRALALTNGQIHGPDGAGALLGVNPNTLRNRMRKLGIPFSGSASR